MISAVFKLATEASWAHVELGCKALTWAFVGGVAVLCSGHSY